LLSALLTLEIFARRANCFGGRLIAPPHFALRYPAFLSGWAQAHLHIDLLNINLDNMT
jgi:hypothetical protein